MKVIGSRSEEHKLKLSETKYTHLWVVCLKLKGTLVTFSNEQVARRALAMPSLQFQRHTDLRIIAAYSMQETENVQQNLLQAIISKQQLLDNKATSVNSKVSNGNRIQQKITRHVSLENVYDKHAH